MLLIAHRSGPYTFPEQTIHSGREALSFGADMVEIDTRLTADGKAAMTHDPNLLRVFGVDKGINDVTEAEFRTFRHAADPAFSSHMIADVFRCGMKPLLIHVKESKALPALLDVIAEYDYAQHVTIGVSDVASVKMIKEKGPGIKILSFSPSEESITDMIEAGVDYVRLWEGWLNPENVALVKNSPAKLWVMSGYISKKNVGYPSEEDLKMILSYEPDGLLINEIPYAKKVLAEMEKER